MIFVDFLSDSGSGTMTDLQWAALFHGDESYARNKGYYVLLDAIRDTFERGDDPIKAINLILSGETNVKKLMEELYLTSDQGGFVNGAWWTIIPPGLCIVLLGVSFLIIGYALDKMFNPLKFRDRSFRRRKRQKTSG